MQLEPGSYIDHYRIENKIEEGGMGTVYKVFDTRLERYVALKMIRMDKLTNENIRKDFYREARALARLKHPNIVHIDAIGEFDGQPYYVMELLSSYTLKNLMTIPMAEEKAISLLIQIADAVAYAHQNNILHRDLKPSNILFDGKTPVLTDFGLAKFTDEQRDPDSFDKDVRKGTLQYMSPEQAMGLPIDGRSDEFALAIILYEMITGARPFGSATLSENGDVINQILRPNLAMLPEDLQPILDKALAREPENRYLTVKQFSDALRSYAEGKAGFEASPAPEKDGDTIQFEVQSEQQSNNEHIYYGNPTGFTREAENQKTKSGKKFPRNFYYILIILLFLIAGIFSGYLIFKSKKAADQSDMFEELPLNTPVQYSLDEYEKEKIYKIHLERDSKVRLSQWHFEDAEPADLSRVNLCILFDNAETCLYRLSSHETDKQPFFLPAGEYQIILRSDSEKTINYTMQWTANPASDIEKERNNNEESAMPITFNTQYCGSLWTIDDIDYYAVNAEASGKISINFVTTEKDNGNTALFEVYLQGSKSPYRMLIGDGVEKHEEWDIDAGVYYLMIRNIQTSGGLIDDSPFNSRVPYQFALVFTPDGSLSPSP